jgi:site-specific recombinase XerD
VAKGMCVIIEPTGSPACPVALMKRFLRQRGDGKGWLFTDFRGKQLTTGAITSIVKKIADRTNCLGHFSSHSLRIGGATAALEGGMSKEQIKAIGGWGSDAVERYMRATEAIYTHASTRMGL